MALRNIQARVSEIPVEQLLRRGGAITTTITSTSTTTVDRNELVVADKEKQFADQSDEARFVPLQERQDRLVGAADADYVYFLRLG